eukprot:3505016-Amphidinium_carterae.1
MGVIPPLLHADLEGRGGIVSFGLYGQEPYCRLSQFAIRSSTSQNKQYGGSSRSGVCGLEE